MPIGVLSWGFMVVGFYRKVEFVSSVFIPIQEWE